MKERDRDQPCCKANSAPEEIDAYLEELKTWLKEDRDTLRGDDGLFSKRLGIYEDVHLGHWPEEYAPYRGFFSGMG